MGRKSELLEAAPLFFEGKLRPAVDVVLPLRDARAAHERLEAGLAAFWSWYQAAAPSG